MIDSQTNKRVEVTDNGQAGLSISISVKHIKPVTDLLSKAGIGHWVDHHHVSIDGRPFVTEIYLRHGTDFRQVQELLDAAA